METRPPFFKRWFLVLTAGFFAAPFGFAADGRPAVPNICAISWDQITAIQAPPESKQDTWSGDAKATYFAMVDGEKIPMLSAPSSAVDHVEFSRRCVNDKTQPGCAISIFFATSPSRAPRACACEAGQCKAYCTSQSTSQFCNPPSPGSRPADPHLADTNPPVGEQSVARANRVSVSDALTKALDFMINAQPKKPAAVRRPAGAENFDSAETICAKTTFLSESQLTLLLHNPNLNEEEFACLNHAKMIESSRTQPKALTVPGDDPAGAIGTPAGNGSLGGFSQ